MAAITFNRSGSVLRSPSVQIPLPVIREGELILYALREVSYFIKKNCTSMGELEPSFVPFIRHCECTFFMPEKLAGNKFVGKDSQIYRIKGPDLRELRL